jgi:hypothetical protein
MWIRWNCTEVVTAEDPVVIEKILTHLNKKPLVQNPRACRKAEPRLK